MRRRPDPERIELEAALQRAFALSARDQLELYSTLHDYLVAAAGIASGVPAELQERLDALDVMERVAERLGLPEGQSPSSTEFPGVARELGLTGWNVTRVGNAFRGSYKIARAVYEGEQAPETVEQQAIRRQTAGRRRTHETYLGGVRQFLAWLSEQPRPANQDDSPHNYDEYVTGHNRQVVRHGGGLLLVKAATVQAGLELSWSLTLAVARNELSYEAAHKQHVAEQGDDEGPLRLIGSGVVADLLGVGLDEVSRRRRRGELPAVAVHLASGRDAWLRDDVEAVAAGRPAPAREDGWMQDQVFLSAEVGARLGYGRTTVNSLVHQGKHHLVPPPDGRVSRINYWARERFEAWLAEPRLKARGLR